MKFIKLLLIKYICSKSCCTLLLVSFKVAMAVTRLRKYACFIFYIIIMINANKCYTQSRKFFF